MKTHATQRAHARTPATCFRLRLQSELARRCTDNPRYSLRAFALDLGTDHATLGQLIRGKRVLSRDAIERLGERLGLDAAELDAYAAAEALARAASRVADGSAEAVRRLTSDTARLVGDGVHYALLELTRLEAFRADSRWAARVLGLTVDDVNLALNRLIGLGMLEMRGERWIDTSGDSIASFEDFARTAVDRFAEAFRHLTERSAGGASDARREHSSTTLAVRSDRLPEAIERLARLRAELVELLGEGAPLDDVYRLEIHLFPVTRIREE